MICDYSINSNTLVLQWHITARCNQRCIHCYQDKFESAELGFEALLEIIEQYKELLSKLNRPGHINVTGGEPFVREDFFELLKVLKENEKYLSFGILTNGTMIDSLTAKKLKELQPAFIQVSMEGNRSIHDSIRGEGNFLKVLEAIKHISENKIKTLVSFTASKDNYKNFPEVAKVCRRHKVFKLWTDRLVPFGGAEDLKTKCLSPEETWEYINIINKCRNYKRPFSFRKGTIIEAKRSLQFLVTGDVPYKCKAGTGLLTIMEDGTVLPCRRLPIPIGNTSEASLTQIYENSPLIKEFGEKRTPPKDCERCSYYCMCGAGARCISYAVSGDMYSRDPGCPIIWG